MATNMVIKMMPLDSIIALENWIDTLEGIVISKEREDLSLSFGKYCNSGFLNQAF
jgi:hypothetical protein